MDLTMFKYHDECGRIGFTEDMYEKKDEIYNQLDHRSKFRFNGFIRFIESKKEDLDDFSKVVYYKTDDKVIIHCKEHGDYEISPNSYICGHRCDFCGHGIISDTEFKNEIQSKFKHIKVIGNYTNMQTYLEVECSLCGLKRKVRPSKLLESRYGCPCLANNMLITDNEYKLRLKDSNIEPLEKYINNSTKLKHKCKICGYEWSRVPILDYQLDGFTCPLCSLIRESNNRRLNVDDINEILIKENKTFICINRDNLDVPTFECKLCGHKWKHDIKHQYLIKGNCPSCNLTKGEERVRDFLEKYNINYEVEKTFKGCKCKGSLRFDFYIPSQNACIEYDGEQHFDIVDFEGGSSEKELKEKLKLNKKRDSIKDKYCKKNGIKLLRIPYYEFDNIENKLIEFLNIDWMFY